MLIDSKTGDQIIHYCGCYITPDSVMISVVETTKNMVLYVHDGYVGDMEDDPNNFVALLPLDTPLEKTICGRHYTLKVKIMKDNWNNPVLSEKCQLAIKDTINKLFYDLGKIE